MLSGCGVMDPRAACVLLLLFVVVVCGGGVVVGLCIVDASIFVCGLFSIFLWTSCVVVFDHVGVVLCVVGAFGGCLGTRCR